MSMDDSSSDPFRKSIPAGDENPFRDDPYAAPAVYSGVAPGGGPPYAASSRRSMVGHVPIVAILMIVQGSLEVVMGLICIGMGAFMPFMMRQELAELEQPPAGPGPDAMSWIFLAIYGGIGLVVLVGAVLHIVAGIRNYRFRGRVFGIVALIAGMATTIMTCYCAPTAIALGIYGLICYMNPEVTQAFDLATAGRTKQEILETLV